MYGWSGLGVVDVAGGRGLLAFTLQHLDGIPGCLMDPRAPMTAADADEGCWSHCRAAVRKGRLSRGVFGTAAAVASTPVVEGASPLCMRCEFEAAMCVRVDQEGPGQAALGVDHGVAAAATAASDFREQRFEAMLTGPAPEPEPEHQPQPQPQPQPEAESELVGADSGEEPQTDDEVECSTRARAAAAAHLRSAVRPVLLGMHACAATEAIVDGGLAGGLPFAVVPCCGAPSMLSKVSH